MFQSARPRGLKQTNIERKGRSENGAAEEVLFRPRPSGRGRAPYPSSARSVGGWGRLGSETIGQTSKRQNRQRIRRRQRTNPVADESVAVQSVGQPIRCSRKRGLQTRLCGKQTFPGVKRIRSGRKAARARPMPIRYRAVQALAAAAMPA